MADDLTALSDAVTQLNIDTKGLEGLELENDKIEWYCVRFNRCMEDGVPDAINSYLSKLQKDDMNELTRIYLLREGLRTLHPELRDN